MSAQPGRGEPTPFQADSAGAVADAAESWQVERSVEGYRGAKTVTRVDHVHMPGGDGGEVAAREYLDHPGAVAALALDEHERVLMLRQYRHPVRHRLWELPAGVRDEEGEPPVATAQRELREEAGFRADRWYELADFFPSPGFSSERIQVFLGRGLTRLEGDEIGFDRVHEETDMVLRWVPLEEAVAAALSGRLHNGAAVVGILAAAGAARESFASLRPAGV
ncbi:NUDIX domain-containing protein [Streptomonospora litoralis]|uniref:ADP-ribose pyrophosphatase n=1 Tax=Streptomonospora litoralis TaxID=2498135 RepID=A0A4V0ZJM5_9ACTN|nr:NUDIX hydrolase [Streptomonospora litoralis]QBI54002.1 ADP-ribose pyrophosphatase [Streptomonospora litoralis]